MKPAPTDELGFPVQADPWEAPKSERARRRDPWAALASLTPWLSLANGLMAVACVGVSYQTTLDAAREVRAARILAAEAAGRAAFWRDIANDFRGVIGRLQRERQEAHHDDAPGRAPGIEELPR